jgi:hypothetical protein
LNNIKALTILLIVGAKIVIYYAIARGGVICFRVVRAVYWVSFSSKWLIELD